MKLKHEKGRIVTLLILGSLTLLSIFTFFSLNFLKNERNTVQTKAQTNNLCPNNSSGVSCDGYSNGDWCIACTGVQGIGKAYLCKDNKWTLPNPNGEPNLNCGQLAPPPFIYNGGVVVTGYPDWSCPGGNCNRCGTTLQDTGLTFWDTECDNFCQTNANGAPCIKCENGKPYYISPNGKQEITGQRFGPGSSMFTLPSCNSQTSINDTATPIPANPQPTSPATPPVDEITPVLLQENQPKETFNGISLEKVSAGMYTNSNGDTSYALIKMDEIPWAKYIYNINGNIIEMAVPPGQTPPSQDMMEKIYNL